MRARSGAAQRSSAAPAGRPVPAPRGRSKRRAPRRTPLAPAVARPHRWQSPVRPGAMQRQPQHVDVVELLPAVSGSRSAARALAAARVRRLIVPSLHGRQTRPRRLRRDARASSRPPPGVAGARRPPPAHQPGSARRPLDHVAWAAKRPLAAQARGARSGGSRTARGYRVELRRGLAVQLRSTGCVRAPPAGSAGTHRGRQRRDHVQLAPAGDLHDPREVNLAQLDRRSRQDAPSRPPASPGSISGRIHARNRAPRPARTAPRRRAGGAGSRAPPARSAAHAPARRRRAAEPRSDWRDLLVEDQPLDVGCNRQRLHALLSAPPEADLPAGAAEICSTTDATVDTTYDTTVSRCAQAAGGAFVAAPPSSVHGHDRLATRTTRRRARLRHLRTAARPHHRHRQAPTRHRPRGVAGPRARAGGSPPTRALRRATPCRRWSWSTVRAGSPPTWRRCARCLSRSSEWMEAASGRSRAWRGRPPER